MWDNSTVLEFSDQEKKWFALFPIPTLTAMKFNIGQRQYLKGYKDIVGPTKTPRGFSLFPNQYPRSSYEYNAGIVSNNLDTTSQGSIPWSNTPEISFQYLEDGLVATPTPPTQNTNSTFESAHDLSVKFSDCYGIYNNKVIKACEFSDSPLRITFRIIKESGSLSELKTEEYTTAFNLILPKLGMINYKDHVIYIERQHKKGAPYKYRKGLTAGILLFNNLSSRELKGIGSLDVIKYYHGDSHTLTNVLSNSIFYPELKTFEEAFTEVYDFKRLSSAFSSSLAIKLDSNSNKIVLQKHSWPIGIYNDKHNCFDMSINTFNDELIKLNIPLKEAV